MPKSKEENVWTIDELVNLTDDIQEDSVSYRGKVFNFQFCELTEGEEPKYTQVPEGATDEEKAKIYQEIAGERILSMIEKANNKNPDGETITKEAWPLLPSSLRMTITTKVLSLEQYVTENFRNG